MTTFKLVVHAPEGSHRKVEIFVGTRRDDLHFAGFAHLTDAETSAFLASIRDRVDVDVVKEVAP